VGGRRGEGEGDKGDYYMFIIYLYYYRNNKSYLDGVNLIKVYYMQVENVTMISLCTINLC
jgi:hypothetical protein